MPFDPSTFRPAQQAAPPPPTGGGFDRSTLTPAAGSTPPPVDDSYLTDNSGKEGLYDVSRGTKVLSVPHSKIPQALMNGYDFADDATKNTFATNWKANPSTQYYDVPTREDFAALQARAQRKPGTIDKSDPQWFRNLTAEFAGDFQNLMDTGAGLEPSGDYRFKNPNTSMTTKTIAKVMEMMAAEPAVKGAVEASPVAQLEMSLPVLKMLEKFPALRNALEIGLEQTPRSQMFVRGMQGGAALGAQDILTGNPRQAPMDVALGTVMGPPSERLGEAFNAKVAQPAISAAGSVAKKVLGKYLPETVDIGSQKAIPVEAGQVGDLGEILPGGTENRETARIQQQRFENDMQVASRRAVRNSLQNLNEAIGPPARPMLPPPSGEDLPVFHLTGPPSEEAAATSPFSQGPGKFQRQGPPTATETTGELLQHAQPLPRTMKPAASYAGEWERTPGPEGGMAGSSVRPSQTATMHPGPEGVFGPVPAEPQTWEQVVAGEKQAPANVTGPVRRDVTYGGGISGQTTNPAEAVAYRNEYRRIIESPEFKNFPPQDQARIQSYHDWLTQELGTHYSQPHGGIIPANIDAASQHVVMPGDAAEQLRNHVQPGYDELDRLTNGKISSLQTDISNANRTLRDPHSSAADRKEAMQTVKDGETQITAEIQRHAGDTPITRKYYNAMKQTSVDAGLLDKFDNLIERWAGGISRQNTANSPQLTQVIRARVQDFEELLNDGNNRELFTRLMGPNAEETVKVWGNLLANPATARKASTLLANVASEIGRMKYQLGTTAITAATIAGTGLGTSSRIAAGVTAATWLARGVMRRAAMNPTITKYVEYAIENNVNPQIYAPLIARTLVNIYGGGQQQQEAQPQQKEKPQQ